MDFELTDEHRLLEQSVREWAGREVAPRIRELDRDAHVRSRRCCRRWPRSGCSASRVPVGARRLRAWTTSALGLACEELEYVDTSLRVILSVHVGLNSLTLLSWGTDDQKARYLVPQAQGERIATFGLTEPAAGSDARGIQTVAVKKGDRYVLTGEKMWISLADVADHVLVFAWTDQAKKKERDPSGMSAFIVERGVHRLLERHAHREVGHPRRQHRLPQAGRRGGAGGESGRARRRGLQDRDVRARPGPLHRGRRRHRADSRLPRRQRRLREGAQDVRRRDRLAPAGEGDDCARWSRTTRRRGCSGCDRGG